MSNLTFNKLTYPSYFNIKSFLLVFFVILFIYTLVFLISSLCSQETLPVTFQACVMTKDCDVIEWSEWSACSKECYDPNGPKGQRTRTRKVSQFPIGGGADCPELEEKEPCTPQGDGVPPCIV